MKTIKNLTAAFVGESCARNFYNFSANIARKEGHLLAAEIFEKTANQENQHAKWLLKMIAEIGGAQNSEIEKKAPSLGDTKQNLQNAISGENFEHDTMYPEFAKIAKEEGFPKIADRLLAIAIAEKNHSQRFSKVLEKIENGEQSNFWECQKCGFLHEGSSAPEKCPSCDHPQYFFFGM